MLARLAHFRAAAGGAFGAHGALARNGGAAATGAAHYGGALRSIARLQSLQLHTLSGAALLQSSTHHPAHGHAHGGVAKARLAAESSSSSSMSSSGSFDSLVGLSAPTRQAIKEEFNYHNMSAVQAQCIPVALQGKDIVARAKTGTGKVCAHATTASAVRPCAARFSPLL